jgi:DNA-binding MarR family transcriptional regulator
MLRDAAESLSFRDTRGAKTAVPRPSINRQSSSVRKNLSSNLNLPLCVFDTKAAKSGEKTPAVTGNFVRRQMKNLARAVEAAMPEGRQQQEELKTPYLEALTLVERLHRRLLDVIKDEFDRRGRSDINSVQALLLFNIGDSELTAGELRSRGYYLGSNVSYNLKKLVEMDYLHHSRSRVDRRSVRISLTDKGREVQKIVEELYQKHVRTIEQVGGIGTGDLQVLNKALQRLERFWTDQILYRL